MSSIKFKDVLREIIEKHNRTTFLNISNCVSDIINHINKYYTDNKKIDQEVERRISERTITKQDMINKLGEWINT